MLTDKEIDEFDVIALNTAATPPGKDHHDWMRIFADLVWNAAIERAAMLVDEHFDELEPWLEPEQVRELKVPNKY